MTALVFPRWVHRDGKKSQVAASADEMAAIEAEWDAEGAPVEPTYAADDLSAAWVDGVVTAIRAAKECGASEELVAAIRDQFEADVTKSLGVAQEAEEHNPLVSEPKRRGRPKGSVNKPRDAVVN